MSTDDLPTWATLTSDFERQTVVERLALCEGNVAMAARSFGLSIPGFLAIRRRLGIPLNPPCRKGRKATRRRKLPKPSLVIVNSDAAHITYAFLDDITNHYTVILAP